MTTILRIPFTGRAWKRLLYVLLSFPLGLFYMLGLVFGFGFSIFLSFGLIGVPLLIAMLAATRVAGNVERGLARRLLNASIPDAPPKPPAKGFSAALRRFATDRQMWSTIVFLFVKFPTGLLSLVVLAPLGSGGGILLGAPVVEHHQPIVFFGWEIDSQPEAWLALGAGILLLLFTVALADLFGLGMRKVAERLLGPPKADLIRQVDEERASRLRMVEAIDAERKRIERDLHDGAQQRIVALGMTLGVAERMLDRDPAKARELIVSARGEVGEAVRELRELAQGIHPTVLSERGLGPALGQLADRAPVPVSVDGVDAVRMPPPVEATIYFVVAEALTNMAKHAHATSASIVLRRVPGRIAVLVADDGDGGATTGGSGLRGLSDRVTALGGAFAVESPPGAGTKVRVELPLPVVA